MRQRVSGCGPRIWNTSFVCHQEVSGPEQTFASRSIGASSQASGRSGLLNKQERIVDFWSDLLEKECGGGLLTVAGTYALRGPGLAEPIRHFPILWQGSKIDGRYLEARRCKQRIQTSLG